MQWPDEIVRGFTAALEIEPAEGYTREEALQALLDETVRRAVWRAGGDPARAGAALRSSYTPLGSLVASSIEGRATTLSLDGPLWGPAVDRFHRYVEDHAVAIFAAFRDDAVPYHDRV
jgi:hypothetical protein